MTAPNSLVNLKSCAAPALLLMACYFILVAGQGMAAEPAAAPIPHLGNITGRVTILDPQAIKARRMPVFKNRQFCGATVPDPSLLVDPTGGVQNAVLLLHAKAGAPMIKPTQLVLDNRHCAFVPHVQVAAMGSDLLLTNSDAILHTVHARLGAETLFNVGLPKWRRVTRRLDRAGIIRIDCDVLHTWMSAVVVVSQTPYWAVTDAAGQFSLPGLPSGAYQAEIWHERLGVKRLSIVVDANTHSAIEVVYANPLRQ